MTSGAPLPVQFTAAGPAPQRRVTVFFRFFMLIPHAFVLDFLGIAASVVAFIGWWGALFSGRLPEFAASYLSGFIRWSTRFQAYSMLLTDQYPPFSLDDDPNYPVRIAVPPRERLNRAAVFFRIILAIPASLLSALLSFGATTIVLLVAWLIALITGKLPTSLHQAYTAVLRYQTRFNCYYYMLTAAYPAGLFGDGVAVPGGAAAGYGAPGYGAPGYGGPGYPAPGAPGAPGYGAPGAPGAPGGPGYGGPGYGEPGYGAGGYTAPGYGAPGYGAEGYGAPGYTASGGYGAPTAPWQPGDWRLLLTPGAKQLVGWFIGIGALLWVAYVVVISIAVSSSGNALETNNAIDTVNAANNTLSSQVHGWQSEVSACNGSVSCLAKADAQAATYFGDFASTLQTAVMPPKAVVQANQLISDATKASQDLTQLSKATSVAQYQAAVNSTGLNATLNQFDSDNNALADALNS